MFPAGFRFLGDYCGYNASGVVLRGGGDCGQNQDRGAFFLVGSLAASYAYADIGCRLLDRLAYLLTSDQTVPTV